MFCSFLLRFSVILFLIWDFKAIEADINENLGASNQLSKTKNVDESSKVNDRISKLETEVVGLKTKGYQERKVIDKLMGRIDLLEARSNVTDLECNNKCTGRKLKRPARLLPPHILRGKEKNISEQEVENKIRFYGPPTSCEDLVRLGYTLNGYYLVKGQQTKNEKIQVILCQFKVPEKHRMNKYISIGNVDLKTKTVHFYVQRKFAIEHDGVIDFHIERLNVGGAMNLKSGIFTVPVNGTYHFQFSGLKSWDTEKLYITLQVNGVDVGKTLFNDGGMKLAYSTASLTASLKLKVGDRVHLFKQQGQLYDTESENFSHFTGWLVDEDIILA